MPTSATRRAALSRRGQEENAQGLIEFAFLVTALMFMFLGVVDLSRFMYYDTAIRNAARVGAETAGNYCKVPACGVPGAPTSDDLVMQATYCEATQAGTAPGVSTISLQPVVNCTPCTTSSCDPCSTSSPYLGACATCQKDICISPSGTRSSNDTVTVYVGYNFRPFSFYMSPFFSSNSCFPSGSTESVHTLCASAAGRVAG